MEKTIHICQGTSCEAMGSHIIKEAFERELSVLNLDRVTVDFTGCHGLCQLGPVVIIRPGDTFYGRVKTEDVPEIVDSHIKKGIIVERLCYLCSQTQKHIPRYQDIPFYKHQRRVVLSNCGQINPEQIDDYLSKDGYNGLKKALSSLTPLKVIDMVNCSGLRGRGGGGFPTGRKWESCQKVQDEIKYVICNADEGDPGAFMDRSVLEGDPQSVIEGMAIAGYAVGAKKGYIYVRAEYPLAVKRSKIAIAQAREKGFLGKNVLGSGFDFDIEIFQGPGAFICGESTALVLSIEGKRGMPKPLPRPRTTEEGLWGKPTLLNNVKTFATIPRIIINGSEWFRRMGTTESPGTAVFSLTGNITNCGLIEVPMGITLREIIYDIGGGIPDGKSFKAVQIGGPSGGCLPFDLLHLPVDFDSLKNVGAMMGSGGMVILNEEDCMVDVAMYFLQFTKNESCGKCLPCREGSKQMFRILKKIVQGEASRDDLELLEELALVIRDSSLCGLGQSVPNPVLTTLKYFRDEYIAHVEEKRCPVGRCPALKHYYILAEKCKGCTRCLKSCPTGAISGEARKVHVIDDSLCTRCGLCLSDCPFDAIELEA